MMNKTYKTLDMRNIKTKPSKIVSSVNALKNVERIKLSKDVLEGKRKVIVRGL